MANSFKTNPIILDTFSSAIDCCVSCGFATGTPFKIKSIEWYNPGTINDTAVITDGNGIPIFSETCFVAKQNIIKDFDRIWVKNICVAQSGVGSGAINIVLG